MFFPFLRERKNTCSVLFVINVTSKSESDGKSNSQEFRVECSQRNINPLPMGLQL